MTPQEKTELRNRRVMAALNMEKPDRIPIFLSGQMDFKYIDPTMVVADYFRRPKLVDECLIRSAALPYLEEVDSPPNVSGMPMESFLTSFASMYFAKIKLPGREVGEDAMWQIDEQAPMAVEGYDKILNQGWRPVKQELFERIGFDPGKLPQPDMPYVGEVAQKVAAHGKTSVGMAGGLLPMPSFEVLCSARGMLNFFKDLRRMPDKMKAVIEIVDKEQIEDLVEMCKAMPGAYGFLGGTRSGSDFINAKTFETFYFPYYQKAVAAMQPLGVKTWFHMDGEWAAFLPFFKEFPKAQCVWDPDHVTDMARIKEALGDNMCITGALPPAFSSLGTPEECYDYTRKVIDIVGPAGFIMNSGCTLPPNARLENIQAAVKAVLDACR